MSDLLLYGSAGGIVRQPDAIENYSGSAETSTECELITKAYAFYGLHSEAVFRRLLITVNYQTVVALSVALYVNERLVPETTMYLQRAQGAERYTWTIPLGIPLENGYVKAVRGTSVQLAVTVTAPAARWYLFEPVIQAMPALPSRRSG